MRFFTRLLAVLGLAACFLAGMMYFRPLWVSDQMVHFHLWQTGGSSEYLDLPEGRIHMYQMQAKGGDGTPLVLVHGLGGRAEDFTAMMPRFAAQGYHVYVPDLLGYGRSAQPDSDYSIRTQEQVVLHFMDARHLDRVDLAGWSMGGWVVLRLALDAPSRVNHLVLFDAAGINFQSDASTDLFAPTDHAGVARLIRTLSPTLPVPPAFVQNDIIRRNGERKWIIDRSLTSMKSGRDIVDSELPRMQPPMLILWGVQDAITPLSVGRTMHALDPRSVLVTVNGCGHYAPVECAGTFVDATTRFLKAQPPMQGGEINLQRDNHEREMPVAPAPVKH